MVLTTRQFTSQQYDASSIKGQGPIVLARAAACQVVGLLVQLGELSQFALDIYQALGYETYGASARIDAVAARTAKIEQQLSIYSDAIEETPPSFYFHNSGDVKWNRSDGMTNNLFSPESRSVPLSKLVNAAFSPPNLSQMSEFSGKDCTILYSDPGFFFKHWAAEEVRKLDAQKEERKRQRDRKPRGKRTQADKVEVQAIQVKVYNAQGHEFGDTTTKSGSSVKMTSHTVAAPRPVASPQINRVPSSLQPSQPTAQPSHSSLTNHHVEQHNDDFHNESFSEYMHQSPSFNAPLPSHPSHPAPPSTPEPNQVSGSALDSILASKTAASRALPPPPRAVNAPPPAAIPPPSAPLMQPPTPQHTEPPTPPKPYAPPTEYQDYSQPRPPQQPPQMAQPPVMPPAPVVAPAAASPPVSPPVQRPINPAAAAFSAAGGMPTLNKPSLQPPGGGDAPPRNALLGALRGGIQLKSAAEPAAGSAPAPAAKPSLLGDIKARPMLRKASVMPASRPPPPAEAPGGLSAVMDILARRGAIADSDSESEDSDWD